MRVVELFAGAGGAALGLRRAGFDHGALIEIDKHACQTLRSAGFGSGSPVIEGDASDVDARCAAWRSLIAADAWADAGDRLVDLDDDDATDWMALRESIADQIVSDAISADLLWASPPCPLHSRANTRRRDYAFDGWPVTLAWVDRLQPEWIAVENVQAALNVARTLWSHTLKARGYQCLSAVLNAADYGVPQHRRRVVLLARRGGPLYLPQPTHSETHSLHLRPHRTLGETVPALLDGADVHLRYVGGRAGSEPWRLGLPAPTVTCTEVKGTRASAAAGWTFHGGPDRASDAAYLAVGRRRLTVRECAALQGFPDSWPFCGPVSAQYRQIGNAVPPAMATAIGRAILEAS